MRTPHEPVAAGGLFMLRRLDRGDTGFDPRQPGAQRLCVRLLRGSHRVQRLLGVGPWPQGPVLELLDGRPGHRRLSMRSL